MVDKKVAFITGIAGQDGSYLAELLLDKGYEVHGLVRHVEAANADYLWRLAAVLDKIVLHEGSITSYAGIYKIISKVKPDECYHFAAQSFVSYSFDDEAAIFDTNLNGTHYVLSALRDIVPTCRFYFAGSSEMFGLADCSPQNEGTKFNPRSLYGIAKAAGFHLTKNYRNSYAMFACSGILYNHESPRRGEIFVTRKITKAVAEIKAGLRSELRLGNLDAKRDWGFAKDYVKAMWLMLQRDVPDDYVIATGQLHTVKEFVQTAFDYVDLDWQKYVVVDKKFYRASEEFPLCGDSQKAKTILNWEPSVDFKTIVQTMVDADLAKVAAL